MSSQKIIIYLCSLYFTLATASYFSTPISDVDTNIAIHTSGEPYYFPDPTQNLTFSYLGPEKDSGSWFQYTTAISGYKDVLCYYGERLSPYSAGCIDLETDTYIWRNVHPNSVPSSSGNTAIWGDKFLYTNGSIWKVELSTGEVVGSLVEAEYAIYRVMQELDPGYFLVSTQRGLKRLNASSMEFDVVYTNGYTNARIAIDRENQILYYPNFANNLRASTFDGTTVWQRPSLVLHVGGLYSRMVLDKEGNRLYVIHGRGISAFSTVDGSVIYESRFNTDYQVLYSSNCGETPTEFICTGQAESSTYDFYILQKSDGTFRSVPTTLGVSGDSWLYNPERDEFFVPTFNTPSYFINRQTILNAVTTITEEDTTWIKNGFSLAFASYHVLPDGVLFGGGHVSSGDEMISILHCGGGKLMQEGNCVDTCGEGFEPHYLGYGCQSKPDTTTHTSDTSGNSDETESSGSDVTTNTFDTSNSSDDEVESDPEDMENSGSESDDDNALSSTLILSAAIVLTFSLL